MRERQVEEEEDSELYREREREGRERGGEREIIILYDCYFMF